MVSVSFFRSKTPISDDSLADVGVFVLAGPKAKFSQPEVTTLALAFLAWSSVLNLSVRQPPSISEPRRQPVGHLRRRWGIQS